MAYQIQYGKHSKKYLSEKQNYRIKPRWVFLLVACTILLAVFVGGNSASLCHWLFPGAEDAIVVLESSLNEGEGIGAAITAFCRHVIENAEQISS